MFENFLSAESFVPACLVQDVQQHSSWVADEQDVALEHMKTKLANGDVIAADLMMQMITFTKSSRKVSEKLAVVLAHTTKLDKEVEMNQLQYQLIKDDLSNLRFMVKTLIVHNDFCMFGKLLPDLYFKIFWWQHCKGWLVEENLP